MAAFYHDSTDVNDPQQREIASIRMIAKMPTIAARAFKYSAGQPFVSPRNELDYASNFLRMCFMVPAEDYKVNPVLARAIAQYVAYVEAGNGDMESASVSRLYDQRDKS